MRKITDHRLGVLNEYVEVVAVDPPDQNGASHVFELRLLRKTGVEVHTLAFQNGPIGGPADVNGISNESLLAIVLDRLRGFQGELSAKTGVAGGQFKCRENAIAITHIEESLMWLQKRTLDRLARGVEGKLQA